jgi:hypothetical protein
MGATARWAFYAHRIHDLRPNLGLSRPFPRSRRHTHRSELERRKPPMTPPAGPHLHAKGSDHRLTRKPESHHPQPRPTRTPFAALPRRCSTRPQHPSHIPHLDGADVIDPASRRQPTQCPTDRLRSFEVPSLRPIRRTTHCSYHQQLCLRRSPLATLGRRRTCPRRRSAPT